ncbi:MAG: copper chaperone PCu(A)C [Oceanicaulis sp.]|nr:copper chaperone PCu(A)C [Oceanicaulis sp.]
MRHSIWLAAASAFALAACNDPATSVPGSADPAPAQNGASAEPAEDAAPAAEMAAISVTGAWVRTPPPGRDVTAGFMTVSADGAAARLVDARTDAAARMEIHTMAMEDDVMRMRRVEGLGIPAGGALTLTPGGDHLMLFDIDRDALAAGEINITLVFEDGQTVNQTFAVRDMAPASETDY